MNIWNFERYWFCVGLWLKDVWFHLTGSEHIGLYVAHVSPLYRMCGTASWRLWKINKGRQNGRGNQSLKWDWFGGEFPVSVLFAFVFVFLPYLPSWIQKELEFWSCALGADKKSSKRSLLFLAWASRKESLLQRAIREKFSVVAISPTPVPRTSSVLKL